jgi:hypothetical protein
MYYVMDFEFKQPVIISKNPTIVYGFQLTSTLPIGKTYAERVNYDCLVNDNKEYISSLISSFVAKCSKYFSKPLDADKLLSRLIHSDYAVNEEVHCDEADVGLIYEWKYTPYRIIISGTEFKIEWCIDEIENKCVIEFENDDVPSVVEAIPIKNDEQDASLQTVNETDEGPPEVQLTEANIPVADDATPVSIKMNVKNEDYKRLKKAQLKVELAKFKAERAYAKYIERWGYLSEDSGSESE